MATGPIEMAREMPPVTVAEIVEGLLLFDEPILSSRFHSVLSRDPDPERLDILRSLPGRVTESQALAREAARLWMEAAGGLQEQRFLERGERFILESYLLLAESQLRLIDFMAGSAPTVKTRSPFDRMAHIHRAICEDLRTVLRDMTSRESMTPGALRSVQEEGASGNLRGQVEAAIRARRKAGTGIRRVVLSHVAQRHLRDQGCFRNGEATILGAPVAIDLSWESSAFVVEGYDVVPLEEILAHERER